MNLARLKEELALIIRDDSLEPLFPDWLNEAVKEIAKEIDLPHLRMLSPVDFPVTTANWLFNPPATFHKNLFKAYDSLWRPIYICKRWEELDATDIDHDETGDHVTKIAEHETGKQFGIYPKAIETLKLWAYEKPTPMVDEDDEPECIPEEFRYRVIIPKLVIKNFKLLQDLMVKPPHQSLQWWTAEYHNGLHGTPRGEIGLLNYLAIRRKPRRHGGRQPLP